MAPRKNYTSQQMERALEAVKNGEKVAAAARQYGVPRITLLNKVTGKTPVTCTMGPATVLTKNEEDILGKVVTSIMRKALPDYKRNSII